MRFRFVDDWDFILCRLPSLWRDFACRYRGMLLQFPAIIAGEEAIGAAIFILLFTRDIFALSVFGVTTNRLVVRGRWSGEEWGHHEQSEEWRLTSQGTSAWQDSKLPAGNKSINLHWCKSTEAHLLEAAVKQDVVLDYNWRI